MATPIILSNEGYIVVTGEHQGGYIRNPFTLAYGVQTACASDFSIKAVGLDPAENYIVRLTRTEDAQHLILPMSSNDPNYPNDWKHQDAGISQWGSQRYIWPNLAPDAQGNLSETLLDNWDVNYTGFGALSIEDVSLGDDATSGKWVNAYTGIYDPNYGLEKRRLADFPENIATEKDGRDLNLSCVKYQAAYTLQLLTDGYFLLKEVRVVVDYVRCCDTLLDYAPPIGGKTHLMTIPVDFDAGDQFWTPIVCGVVTPSKPFEYSEAMRRDFATAPADNLQIHTLEIYCAEDPQQESYFLCNDLQDHTLTTEEGETRLFQAANFSFTLPQTNGDGAPEMQVAISNINGEVFGYIDRVRDFGSIVVKYRPFLASDTSTPQTTHPMTLSLSEISADPFQITGRISFVDILNKSFPSIKYNIANFPNIYS